MSLLFCHGPHSSAPRVFRRPNCAVWFCTSQRKSPGSRTRSLMSNLLSLAFAFFGAALLYGFRERVLGALRRFEARNAQRRRDEARALIDKYGHYRQTVQFADEQIEQV